MHTTYMTCTRTINVRGSSHSGHYYRLFSPNCPLVVAVQCASRHIPTPRVSRTLATHLSSARMYALTYTCHHNDTLQFRAGAPLILREDPTLRRRPSSSLLPSRGRRLPDPPSRSVSGNTLSSAPRRAIGFPSHLFEKGTRRNREDRGSIA